MKTCQRCHTEKPLTEFHKDRTRKDGLHVWCKVCVKRYKAATALRPSEYSAKDGFKKCYSCKEIKPTTEFFALKGQYDGLHRMCRICATTSHRKWAQGHREHVNKKMRERRAADPKRFGDYFRKLKFGLQPGEYDRMLAAQGGRCAICGTDKPKGGNGDAFAVDHCHDTGMIRGLLCGNHNLGLGYFNHDPRLLRLAAEYLEASRHD